MSRGDKKIVAWPVVDSGGVFQLESDSYGTYNYTVSAATRINLHSHSSYETYRELVQAAFDAAFASWGDSGAVSVSIVAGKITLTVTAVLDDVITVKTSVLASTWDVTNSGLDRNSNIYLDDALGKTATFHHQGKNSFVPEDYHDWDSKEQKAQRVEKARDLKLRPHYAVHSDLTDPPIVRDIKWPRVAGARVRQGLLDEDDFAEVANLLDPDGIHDPNAALDNLILAAFGGETEFYVADDYTGDADVSSAYYVDIEDSTVELGTTPDDKIRTDIPMSFFRIMLRFVR